MISERIQNNEEGSYEQNKKSLAKKRRNFCHKSAKTSERKWVKVKQTRSLKKLNHDVNLIMPILTMTVK